jgi:CRISPR-associated protein Csb2
MKFAELPVEDRRQFALLSGKTESGAPLTGHQHAYFVLLPDEFNQPTRLLCLRRTPFQPDEIAVLLAASETTIAWQPQRQDWRLRLVPLPFSTPVPSGLSFDGDASPTWRSVTPFVVPGGRRRFRKNGRLRPAETPERLLEKLLVAQGLPRPKIRSLTTALAATEWVTIHESKEQRAIRRTSRTRAVLPGYRFEIKFPEPVSGPICVGHSCHFGLGLFVPTDGASLG